MPSCLLQDRWKARVFDVEVRDITKRFGRVLAVDHVSLAVEKGRFVTLLGPSGCGKTTTLRIIGGFETADSGSVLIGGESADELPPFQRDTSMVFQDYALFPHMTVEDNVAFGLRMRHLPDKEVRQKVVDALNLVDLPDVGSRRPSQLSGGQRQRVALARSLVIQPLVLLLDEPLGALDAKTRKQMQIELKNLQKKLGQTFIYVTHDQEEALTMSDIMMIMNSGRVEQVGMPSEIYERPASRFVADFLGHQNLIACKFIGLDGDLAVVAQEELGQLRGVLTSSRIPHQGSDVVFSVRGENIRTGPPSAGLVDGRLVSRVYRGAITRNTVRVGTLEVSIETTGPQAFSTGDLVSLDWHDPDCVVIWEEREESGG